MAKGESLRKALTDLYEEYGKPLVDRIVDTFDGDVTPQQVRRAVKSAARPSLAAKPQKSLAVQRKALPAPPKPLALPAPGPGLPPFAVKPKGGQWMVDRPVYGSNLSAEYAARGALRRMDRPKEADKAALFDWWHKALPRYIKNELGTPEDPLRDLAARDLLHVNMNPDEWSSAVAKYISAPNLQNLLYGRDAGRDYLLSEMPWLAKIPATENVYGISPHSHHDLEFDYVADELGKALRAEQYGLPPELALRPESLQRMSFPAAVERVGRINQFRVKQAGDVALKSLNSPAVQTFKEYAEDNPMGLRWLELKAPDLTPETLPEGWRYEDGYYVSPKGDYLQSHPNAMDAERDLSEALNYEGEAMGHCAGDYCPDIMEGSSRLFSLRDAKGRPHVTIETRPGRPRTSLSEIPRDALDQITAAAKADTDQVTGPMGIGMDDPRWTKTYQTNLSLKQREWLDANPTPDEIKQIKGKQNAGPTDTYLPFVQDFVKSQPWSNIADMENTGLVKLPDGRYITQQQFDAATTADALSTAFAPSVLKDEYYARTLRNPSNWDAEDWEKLAPNFEGFAIGGRVDADRCFCHNPFSVKKGR